MRFGQRVDDKTIMCMIRELMPEAPEDVVISKWIDPIRTNEALRALPFAWIGEVQFLLGLVLIILIPVKVFI